MPSPASVECASPLKNGLMLQRVISKNGPQHIACNCLLVEEMHYNLPVSQDRCAYGAGFSAKPSKQACKCLAEPKLGADVMWQIQLTILASVKAEKIAATGGWSMGTVGIAGTGTGHRWRPSAADTRASTSSHPAPDWAPQDPALWRVQRL